MSSLLPGNLVPKKKTIFSGRVANIKKVKEKKVRNRDAKSSGRIPSIGTLNNEKDSDGSDSIQSSDLSSSQNSSSESKSESGDDKQQKEYVKPTVTQSKFVRLKK